MKTLSLRFKWTARAHGGLFLGVRYDFPISIIYDRHDLVLETHNESDMTRIRRSLSLGFIFFTINLTIRTRP